MKTYAATIYSGEFVKSVCIDAIALAFIYFTPSIAHLFAFPVYMIEPMRLMVILSMAHSSPKNSYLLAMTLPLFSFIATSHPEFIKMLIITGELVFNVFLFYRLSARIKNTFLSMISAILISKALCYLMYLVIFSVAFVREESGTLFLVVQLITMILFSAYIFFFWKKRSMNE